MTTVQLGGVGGIPAGSSSLAGVALNAQLIGGSGGYLRMWPSDETEPTSTSTVNNDPNATSSNLTIVRPSAADGTIKIRNVSPSAVNLVLDAEGYFTNPSVLPAAVGTGGTGSGSRSGASMIKRSLTDRSGVQINPINGNLLYSQALLSLAGIGQGASVGLRYNALNDNRPTLNVGLFETQLYRNGTTNAVTYTAPDGAAYVFTELTGAGSSYAGKNAAGGNATLYRYSKPAGLQADLVRVGSGYGPGTEYDLTFHPSQAVNVYSDNGSNIAMNSSQDVTGANTISYTYAKGALTRITDTQGRTIDFAYASPNNTTQPSTITDNSLGRTITLTYGATGTPANGAVTKIVDATGAQTLFAYNTTSGQLTKVTDGRGDATSFTYDGSDRLATMITAATTGTGVPTTTAGTWTMAYSTSTQTKWTDPNGNATKYNFTLTPLPQVISVVNALGHTQSAAYNSHNDPTSLSNGLTDATTYGYDSGTSNLNKITAPSGGDGTAGRSASFTYTPAGAGTGPFSTADFRPNSVTDAQNDVTALAYNNFGETSSVASSGGEGGTQHRTYQGDNTSTPAPDCTGHTGQLCTSTDGKGNVTSYAYNPDGNLRTMTPPAPLGAHTFTYDAAGRKVSETDGRGNTAYTCYDLNDRITQVSYTTAACGTVSGVTYTYDPVGNMTQRVDASGTTTVTYDAMNRALTKTLGSTVTSVSYDPADNLTGYTDAAGTVAYRYDPDNNVQYLSEPGGTCPATPAFPNTTGCVKFVYNNAEHRTATYLPNGVVNTDTYDTSQRMTKVAATNGATVIAERDYLYGNAAGADTSLIQSTTDPLAGISSNYTYDQLNRLTTTAVGPTPAPGAALVPTTTSSWTYDLNGNRTQQTITGTGAATTNYGYNAADQLCWSATTAGTGCTTPAGGTAYTYDGNGNQTSGSNSYSNYDQLTSAATVGAQTYAGTTNSERTQAGANTFTNSILGQVSTTVLSYSTQEYVRDPDGTLIAMQIYPSGSTTPTEYYYTQDTIKSTIAITNSAGIAAAAYTYDSWGNTTATIGGTFATTTNPWRYASGYTDPNGTIKFGARYYNPTLGRFTQTDPSGQEQNVYAYVGGNPINKSDPTGLCGEFWQPIPCPQPFDPASDDFDPTVVDAVLGVAIAYVATETCELLEASTECALIGGIIGGGSAYGLDKYGEEYGFSYRESCYQDDVFVC